MSARVGALLAAFAGRLAEEKTPAAQTLAGRLLQLPDGGAAPASPPPPPSPPACAHLAQTFAHGTVETKKILRMAVTAAAAVRWHAGPGGFAGGESGIAYAVLAGPDGCAFCESCRAGLYVQQPRLVYPPHAHDPAEFYFVLSGFAEWRAGERNFTAAPGQLIYHAAAEPHAMTTLDAPLFALWGWLAGRGRYWFCQSDSGGHR
ncbi:MAG: dimethylsulfonioproprionate lyase family protein [Gammaproteobacteria bacterium]|nr:dimethylsulfonioproprionate lyase family protein [Gammaproteobacteria bacterium]